MEAENQILTAFQQILTTQPDLFKDSQRRELEGLITSLPNDPEQLAEAIARWCNSHSGINNALMALIAGQTSGEKGPGGIFPSSETLAEDEKNLRQTLINALRQSSPPEKSKPKLPKADE